MTESITPNTYIIRQARPDEAGLLTELNWRSKAYWGYGDDFMNLVRDDMITTSEDIINEHVYVLENSDHRIMGDMSVTTEAVTIVPATTAAGVASESSRLSTHGK